MNRPHILLVEDEPHIASGLIYNLEEEGYQVTHAGTGEAALQQLWLENFSLVVLDLMLPGISGIEVCQIARKQDPKLPILMLTARGEDKDRIEGLEVGADDYLTKPFNLDEFLLRIKGMLRRSDWYRPRPSRERDYRFGRNSVNLQERTALAGDRQIELTDIEVKLLRIFFQREAEILSRTELLAAAWDLSPDTETRTLDNFVVRLRKYFEPNPSAPVHFQTIRGRGYRFMR
ncbi:MAG: response regulator transcription factor [Desulfuromonadales bacterium]|nr:response regulator transcription factor [Desulfuromonadales bacterium]